MRGTALSLVFRLFFDRMKDQAVKVKSRQLQQRPKRTTEGRAGGKWTDCARDKS